MAGVFNICFHHKGASYSALVMVSGNPEDDASVRVTSNEDSIRIILPSGSLVVSISELMRTLSSSRNKNGGDTTVYITNNISLQLLTPLH
ncbi:MAG TPA: hypothetical protein VNR87_11190 [Flavisolibacter sp.]|nr:hypothetical protein [Flavisolibacter sp.]